MWTCSSATGLSQVRGGVGILCGEDGSVQQCRMAALGHESVSADQAWSFRLGRLAVIDVGNPHGPILATKRYTNTRDLSRLHP